MSQQAWERAQHLCPPAPLSRGQACCGKRHRGLGGGSRRPGRGLQRNKSQRLEAPPHPARLRILTPQPRTKKRGTHCRNAGPLLLPMLHIQALAESTHNRLLLLRSTGTSLPWNPFPEQLYFRGRKAKLLQSGVMQEKVLSHSPAPSLTLLLLFDFPILLFWVFVWMLHTFPPPPVHTRSKCLLEPLFWETN